MKKLVLILLCLSFITLTAKAQIINIPDANFKSALINLGIDKNNDGQIQQNEVETIDTLNIKNKQIKDITGIENFTRLTYLDCSKNQKYRY